jgi:uncharacterized protein DUF4873
MTQHQPQEQYAGPVAVILRGVPLEVEAELRGRFDPIDGRFHWYGRLAPTPALESGASVTITTRHGSAEGRLSDIDPWGRLRVSGTGTPPF